MKVVFSERAFTSIMCETSEKIDTETGGLFLGKFCGGVWYVIEAIDPGPKSIFEVAYFEYDQKYTQHLINKIANLYHTKLELIGLWHRHPGSMDYFSYTDDETNRKYASMRKNGAISGLVNIDPKFRFTIYHVGQPNIYTRISFDVGDEYIPYEYKRLKTKEDILRLIDIENADILSISLHSFIDRIIPFVKKNICKKKLVNPQLTEECVRKKIIDTLMDDLVYMTEEFGIVVSVIQDGYYVAFVQTTADDIKKIIFMYDEDEDIVVFNYKEKNYYYKSGDFYRMTVKMLNSESSNIITFPCREKNKQ